MEQIDVAELKKRLEDGAQSATLVDVRTPGEYAAEHVEGSENIPLQTIPEAIERLRALPNLCLICASGNRSGMACEFLVSVGVPATNVAGGVGAWHATGFPLV